MTQRKVNGDAVRSKHSLARKKIEELGLTPDVVDILAEGVREFDEQRSTDQRTAAAVEQIARNTTPERENPNGWGYEERRLRRREVVALELLAVVPVATDEELVAIQAGSTYRRIIERLTDEAIGATP